MDKVWRKFLLGWLATLVLMAPTSYAVLRIFPLLGYDDPADAPFVLRTAALTLIILIMVVVLGLTTGDTYQELQKRRRDNKRGGRDRL